MRHQIAGRQLGRSTAHRLSLFRNLTRELFLHGAIVTSEAKAKEARTFAERIITLGKDGSLAARRQALAFVTDKKAIDKLFDDIAPQYKERAGGYTRITKLGPRRGDGADVVRLELV